MENKTSMTMKPNCYPMLIQHEACPSPRTSLLHSGNPNKIPCNNLSTSLNRHINNLRCSTRCNSINLRCSSSNQ